MIQGTADPQIRFDGALLAPAAMCQERSALPEIRHVGPGRTFLRDVALRHAEQILGTDLDLVAHGRVDLVWLLHVGVEDLLSDGYQTRMSDPGAVVAGLHFAFLVVAYLPHGLVICRLPPKGSVALFKVRRAARANEVVRDHS